MTVIDRNKIDITYTDDNKYVLVIVDHLEWNFATRQAHCNILQNKINDYLNYISSGQATKKEPGLRPVIKIVAKYSYSKYSIEFLEIVKKHIKENGDICDIEWDHSEQDGDFNDGFNDDYVFEPEKIYPRIKKNLAKKPLKEISLLLNEDDNGPSSTDNLVLFRYLDSLIQLIMVDSGDKFSYFSYDMLPENITPEKLQEIAFENLTKNIEYRCCESKEPGVYGIIAGGNFEAESICLPGIWQEQAERLEDDIIISIPTKDVVFFTKLNDKNLRKKMIKLAYSIFKSNRKETPELVFSKDIFIYSRKDGNITISSKYSL